MVSNLDYWRVFASVAGAVGVTALCQCSLFFDLDGLDNGGAAGEQDAATAGSDTGVGDARTSEGGLDATVGADGLADTGATTPDEAGDDGDDTGHLDAPTGTGGETAAPEAGGLEAGGLEAGGLEAGGLEAGGLEAGGPDAGGRDAAADSGGLAAGLVAFYAFDETSGATSVDVSGNNPPAIMQGATFSGGLRGNAATLNGTTQYVSLPPGIVSGLTSFSISAWVYEKNAAAHNRIFDFGTGTTAYMFLSPDSLGTRFSITAGGSGMEQRLDVPMQLVTGSWQHLVVTLSGTAGVLYVNGAAAAQNAAITLNPASLGSTTQNWLGRSQWTPDPYLSGQIDELRIYNRALGAAEVQQLFRQR